MPAQQHRHRWRVEKRGVKRNAERAQSAASSAAAATGGAWYPPFTGGLVPERAWARRPCDGRSLGGCAGGSTGG